MKYINKKITYQSISRFILVDGADPGPVEVLKQSDPRHIECILRGDDTEEIRERLLREHWVCVRIG